MRCIYCGLLSTHYSPTIRAEVQIGARLLWEQEAVMLFSAPPRARSTPRCPTLRDGGRGLEPPTVSYRKTQASDKRTALSSILRATTGDRL